MKQLLSISFLILFSSSFCIAQEGLFEKLPEQIQLYMQTYFINQKVTKYRSDLTVETAKYKVFIDNGVSVTFDETFQPIEIDGETSLPENVIPQNILSYVKKYFPNQQIKQWQRRVINQTISLDDGTKIKFDSEGNFIRVMRS